LDNELRQGWSLLIYCSSLCLEGLKKTVNTFNQNIYIPAATALGLVTVITGKRDLEDTGNRRIILKHVLQI
jgi:hypothetical protein